MTNQEKLTALSTAYTVKKVEDAREQITVINDENPIKEDIKAIQFRLNDSTGTFELDYEIMWSACDILSDIELDKLADADLYELANDSASVYTSTRLGYLSNQNEGDISDILKEYNSDIQTACAIWYDQQVAHACEMLREYVLAI